jgi:hypothetical protein
MLIKLLKSIFLVSLGLARLSVQFFLYYILLFFTIFKIVNIEKKLFLEIIFEWFKDSKTKLKKDV